MSKGKDKKATKNKNKKDNKSKKQKNGRKETRPGTPVVNNEQTFLARVYVALKPTVNDPEGVTIGNALGSLGFDGVQGVRSGKYFQVTVNAKNMKCARRVVDQMCARLLANPVIETYAFEVSEA
ncbi:MAG: phosphoribosylformylglycinamidine synthase subunit PurS [Dehalococcoidia bacterium]|nr:phosphoribosylformylglycinamidine synthase subunit PurS [Dehalococcoidia bacterium]